MANYNDWNRNRNSSSQDWNNDEFRNGQQDNNRSAWGHESGNYGGQDFSTDRGRFNNDSDRYRDSFNRGSNSFDSDWNNRSFRDNSFNRYGHSEWNRRNMGSNFNRDFNNNDYDRGYGNQGFGQNYNREDFNNRDRGWWDKTKDEVSSWFGDEDAERRRRMDERSGPHRGKGPRGYTRSDERIKEDINDRLNDDSNVDASEIEATVTSGEVTLTGTVSNRQEKRRAEDLAEAVSGVKNVENRLRVKQESSFGSQTTGDTGSWNSRQSSDSSTASTYGTTRNS